MTKRSSTGVSNRSAVTGRYVTPHFAARNPNTTVGETRPKPKK